MNHILRELKDEKKLASLYPDLENTDKALTGYILDLSEEEFLMAHISARGEYNGFIMERPEHIFRAETESSFERRLESLYLQKRRGHETITRKEDQTVMEALLVYAKANQRLMSFRIKGEKIYKVLGFVLDFSRNFIKIQKITQDSFEDGFAFLDVQCVDSCQCDTEREQDVLILYRVNS